MQTVTSVYSSEYRIKGSKFLGFLFHSSTVDEIESQLELIKKKHLTATHHCYAYILKPNEPVEFSTDAGEPSGTAGLPILNALKSQNLMNVLLIVVRYYGGTKLGKSGLIDAYQTISDQTIHSAVLKQLVPVKTYQLKYDYSQQSFIDKWRNNFPLIEINSSYTESVELTVGCPKSESKQFEETVSAHKHQLINFETAGESFHIEE